MTEEMTHQEFLALPVTLTICVTPADARMPAEEISVQTTLGEVAARVREYADAHGFAMLADSAE